MRLIQPESRQEFVGEKKGHRAPYSPPVAPSLGPQGGLDEFSWGREAKGNGTLTGAMSMTAYNAAQGINSFRGPVSINLSSGRVTADIIGKNLVGPGRNIPATQRGDLQLTRRGHGGGS